MPCVIQRRGISSGSSTSTVLPSTNQDIIPDAPSRPRRRSGLSLSTSTKIKTYFGRWRWAIIIFSVSIILFITWIFAGSNNAQSSPNWNHLDENVDSSKPIIDSRHVVQTSLPLSKFSDLSYALQNSDLVALYFAASWCPMSTPVSHLLDSTFGENVVLLTHDGKRKTLSIVYISSDKTIDEFNGYIRNRNWIAVPYESSQRNLLKRHFSTCAKRELVELDIDRMHEIPTIIVIDSATHGIITFNGVNDLETLGEESLEHWKDIQSWTRTAKVE